MTQQDAVERYIGEVRSQFASGHAREHAYRPALERLMGSFDDVTAVNDPKRSENGNPDMIFLKTSHASIILGYAEAKDVDVSLDKTEKTNQMERYSGYANLFLTDYLEFRFYANGEKYQTINLGGIKDGALVFDSSAGLHLADELAAFLALPPEKIRSGRRLAEIMGAKARRVRDNVSQYLANPDQERNGELDKIFKMMRELLVHDLTAEKFADMYAQTLVYGLFIARYGDSTPENFSRQEARDLVPKSNPFLRKFFDHIAGADFDTRLKYIVDELCEVFAVSNVKEIVHKHLKVTNAGLSDRDPIIHFYEDFLKEYDPAERKRMGAYYTPIPVVRFIIRQVDEILKRDFGIAKGLADSEKIEIEIERGQEMKIRSSKTGKVQKTTKQMLQVPRVQVLDPAVGTATFLNETIKFIYEGFVNQGQEGRWPSYAKADLLPRLHGFELMMAPYTIAHLKLGMTLQETGVTDIGERLGVYLTNTLEEGMKTQPDLFSFGLAEAVSHEAEEAAKIKHERPIMVVMGNPPYSVSSNNKSDYIQNLIKDYKKDLNERKINLDDDYIKFIRFAEEMISKNGEGIVAMITNNSFIDGITHRQMRKHLLETFDQIYILDLHGSAKKNEVAPDGGKDENVFAIQQGVSISIFVKRKNPDEDCQVYYQEVFGDRASKFSLLNTGISWRRLALAAPNYFFAPKNFANRASWDEFISVDALFQSNNSGIQSKRDKVCFPMTTAELAKITTSFLELGQVDIRAKYGLPEDGRDWKVEWATNDLKHGFSVENVLYRPFDLRPTAYTGKSKGFIAYPRESTFRNFLGQKNLGLITVRQQSTFNFQHVLVTANMIESGAISLQTKEWGYIFPLYIYHDDGTYTANFKPDVLKLLVINLTRDASPEDILDYTYAILHSPKYRETYKEFLKIDFPRVPVPAGENEFRRLVNLGKELRELHLMTSPVVNRYETSYPEAGSDDVNKIAYVDDKVWINDAQYFGNVPEAAWSFYIGGYQPAQKWLKDRKGRKLSNEDIEHYQKIIKVLLETARVMGEVDRVEWSHDLGINEVG